MSATLLPCDVCLCVLQIYLDLATLLPCDVCVHLQTLVKVHTLDSGNKAVVCSIQDLARSQYKVGL